MYSRFRTTICTTVKFSHADDNYLSCNPECQSNINKWNLLLQGTWRRRGGWFDYSAMCCWKNKAQRRVGYCWSKQCGNPGDWNYSIIPTLKVFFGLIILVYNSHPKSHKTLRKLQRFVAYFLSLFLYIIPTLNAIKSFNVLWYFLFVINIYINCRNFHSTEKGSFLHYDDICCNLYHSTFFRQKLPPPGSHSEGFSCKMCV